MTEINLESHKTTLITGKNGQGKCLRGSTNVEIDFQDDKVKQDFLKFINSRKE